MQLVCHSKHSVWVERRVTVTHGVIRRVALISRSVVRFWKGHNLVLVKCSNKAELAVVSGRF